MRVIKKIIVITALINILIMLNSSSCLQTVAKTSDTVNYNNHSVALTNIMLTDTLCNSKVNELKEYSGIIEHFYTVEEQHCTMWSTTSVNVRKEPSTESDIVGYLCYGDSIEVIGEWNNSWYCVYYESNVAYVKSEYLQKEQIVIPIPVIEESAPVVKQITPYSGIIQREGNVSDDLLREIDYYYNKLPDTVRTLLENSGWKYICTDKDFAAMYGYTYSILALSVYEEKLVYIDNKESAKEMILHEAGHAFDSCNGYISYSDEFINIFNTEHETFANVHHTHINNTSTASEYFAESFYVYTMDPTLVQTNCPRTYEFITRYIQAC